MARIKIRIEDDNGELITAKEFSYVLNSSDGQFNTLEGEVDRLKKDCSAKITATLFEYHQEKFVAKKKRRMAKKWNSGKNPS